MPISSYLPDATPVPDKLRGEVELKHVDFSYPTRPDIPVFKDLNLRARAGKTLALVGPSGCGKSSVISLVQRFYEPTSGRVMIDGKDIRKFNLKSLRKHIAMVPQEPCLFAASIYDNIAYGHESATEAEIIEAATLANAHKFISGLPEGYKTFVGERGVQLSGGQKQRIAIAQQGSHSHLLKNYPDGCYARMIQLQRFTHSQVIGMTSGSTSSARTREDEVRDS
uniref:Multidrug resistance protein 1, 2 n=1 Tax=Cucumis sativus TaxID=3659 RepID=A0A0A0LFT9_CUCSA